MSEPLVSVVIPSYNYGAYVGQAVDSALAQTYPHVEVIVVDDGSTDDTRQRLSHYGTKIRYVYQQNQGLSAARNSGIREARGEFISLIDSDDAIHPRLIELVMNQFQNRPRLGLCGTSHFNEPEKMWPTVSEPIEVMPITMDQLVIKSRFCPSSVVFRKECVTRVSDFDTSLKSVEDRDFWIRVSTQFEVAKIDAPLSYYRITPGSMSRNPSRMEHFEFVVLEKAFQLPELRHRWLLRRKAYGLALASAAFEHFNIGLRRTALLKMLRSFLIYPIPLRVPDVHMSWARIRLLRAMLMRSSFAPPSPTGG